ncbi:MAG: LPS assembly lipoprotein LptE [Crocinitomicaceae bacterium]
MRHLYTIFIIALFCSCEVQYSMLDSSIDAESFSVSTFEGQAANAPAGYAIRFTEFLRDFIVSRSKMKLKKENADIEISGIVTSYYTSPVAVQQDEIAALNRLSVTILVSVINNRDEKQSFEKNFTQFSDYESSQNLAAVEEALLEDINEKLGQDIINELSKNW